MNLELNLVRTDSIFSQMCTLISRSRRIVADGEEVMSAIIDFIQANIVTFDAASADKELVARLQALQSITVTDFQSLRFLLSQTCGLDILVYAVAEMEVNADSIAQDTYEYNVIDELPAEFNFVKEAAKVVVGSDAGNMGQVYDKALSMYGYFEGELFKAYRNPLKSNIELLKSTEQAMGVTPANISNYINSVLEYLGKKIMLIMPE